MIVNQNNIPKLRFPEFSDAWEVKKLGEVAEKINSGKTPLGGESVYSENGIMFIRSQNVKENMLSYENATFISEKINNSMKNSIVKPKDMLLNITGASLGRSCVVPEDFTIGNVNQHVCIIRIDKNNDPFFIQPILASEKGQNLFLSLQTGSGREGLNFQSIRGIEISFPTLPEQQKISTFLSTLDEKLQALKKKKSLLETYKKGVMQKLFLQEIRFKDGDGNDFDDWEVKKLGDLIDMVIDNRGKTPPVEQQGIPLLEVNCIGSKEIKYNRVSKYVSELTFKNWFRKYLKNGDVLFSTVGNTALCSYYDAKYIAVIAQNIVGLRFKKELGLFMYFLLIEENNYKKMKSIEMGAVQPSIKVTQLTELFFDIPSLPEQTKIANFLTAIDEKINKVDTQIKQTELWKKGLLQGMFV